MSTTALMTAEQFALLETADTEDHELVEGELIPLSSGTPLHARIRSRFDRILGDFFARSSLGEGDRVTRLDPEAIPVPFAPDIAIEILSASERAVDVSRKAHEYLAAGSKEVWIVDQSRTRGAEWTRYPASLRRGQPRIAAPARFFSPCREPGPSLLSSAARAAP